MGLGFGRKEAGSHAVSFLLGTALPTALLFLLASDRLGEGLSSISRSWGSGPASDGANEVIFKGLPELLPRVAMEDRTVIITSVNEAWAQPGSLLDLYLESFRDGVDIAHLLNHLLEVALDARGFERCKAVHPHCYFLNATSVDMSSAKPFMSPDCLELVWTKLTFQQRVLELGYNFLFTARSSIIPSQHFQSPSFH
ncbi:uncharacterized protein C2845_PM13G17480 [Panicum miliaceum]|uniref:Nucleotide-diphospho-sugar transferase domain-containing protein n=1 Tax=Panicum miliaceum TaxID=4540 RepID=A0A3L6RGN2_PANMI|nr:uncharacterized protein C2845_PM13G17480 [Panicum miliaceum]